MKSAIDWIKLVFIGFFVVSVGVIWYIQVKYVWPRQQCEAHGDWWDDEDRVCAVPMPIWAFTHRMPGQPRLAPETPPPAAQIAPAKPAAARPAAPAAKKP